MMMVRVVMIITTVIIVTIIITSDIVVDAAVASFVTRVITIDALGSDVVASMGQLIHIGIPS